MIPYGRQEITQDDIDSVVEALGSDFLTQGPRVPEFEASIARYCSTEHAVAFNSATSGLHVACLALGIGPGDEVWTSPITFVASANCARYCGASVDFVDIDLRTFNMSVAALEAKLEQRQRSGGKLPAVVIPVHMCGQSADMAAVREIADKYGFRIIEDAAHAIGGKYRDRPVGDCAYSDITVFSFHPVKGGVATTRDPELARRMELFRSNGITRDAGMMQGESEGPWFYEQIELGYNYRMTDLQAALGSSQMRRLDEQVARRHAIASRYDELLADLPVFTPVRKPFAHSAFHLYVVLLDEALAARRRAVFESMRGAGIGVNVHYIPVHQQPYYRALGFAPGDFPVAEDYYSRAITIPLFPALTREQQDTVVEALGSALS